MNLEFPQLEQSSALIHIAFHYNYERLKYLKTVIDTICGYEFCKISVVIDTNSEEFKLSDVAITGSHVHCRVEIHERLEHPYLLTWAHRDHIEVNADEYDYYMYIEDDIAVSWDSLNAWRDDQSLLHPLGLLRGFVRTETRKDGALVASDYESRQSLKKVIRIENKRFLHTGYPYQAFWIYSKNQLDSFINSRCWREKVSQWGIRENAAAGMTWLNPNEHRVMIPMTDQAVLDERAFVQHLPSNYVDNLSTKLAKITFEDLFVTSKFKLLLSSLRGENQKLLQRLARSRI